MLLFANNIDITSFVTKNSIRVTEQMNNRSNTLVFGVDNYNVSEGSKVELFENFVLRSQASSGQAVLAVSDTFEFENKFAAGDEIILDIKQAWQKFATILSVNHSAKTITLTSNLTATLAFGVSCGRLVFSGVTMRNPNKEIGMTGTFSYSLTATDWTKIFDNKAIADVFENQYSREMIGRIVYSFTARDTSTDLDLFEAIWTPSGTALAMVLDTTDRLQGTNSVKTGTSWSGVALWTKTISSVDISAMDHFRFWFKIDTWFGGYVTAVKFRIGSDSSNYYEGTSAFVGHDEEGCWNFESFKIDRATTVWAPNEAAIDWLQIEVVTTAAITTGKIHFDHAFVSSGGFTCKNCIRGDRKFVDVRVQYKKPTVFMESLAKIQNFFWYIDYERDVHFFKMDATPAPFSLTDSSQNFSDLSITTDIAEIKNRQTVRGWIAVDQTTYTQDEVTDGKLESWRLDYSPKDLQIWVDTTGTWSSFVQKTVGIENLDDPASFEYLFNFSEKIVRRSTDTIPPDGAIFRRIYYPYKPIRVRVQNQASIDAMKLLLWGDGIFDGAVINDSSIRDWNEARMRWRAEVNAYCNPVISASFSTQQDWLKAGQIIHITDTSRGINNDFLIQKLTKSSRNDDRWTYHIDAGSTMFGLIEFFQLLLAKTEKFEVDISEIVDIVLNDDETITITPAVQYTHTVAPFRATSNLTKWFDFVYEVGSYTTNVTMMSDGKNSGFNFTEEGTEVGTIEFDTLANYEWWKAMKMTTTVGWSGQKLLATNSIRIPAKASASYAFSAWVEILTALTGSGGFSASVKEYAAASGWSVLATTVLLNGVKSVRDYNRTRTTFTTNASTNFIEIELKIDNAVGTVSIGEMVVEDLTAETATTPWKASFATAI